MQTEGTELNNAVIELKNTLEQFNRLDEAKDQISTLEEKAIEVIQTEQQKRKKE